jgi:ADP-ribosylglycohydrolase
MLKGPSFIMHPAKQFITKNALIGATLKIPFPSSYWVIPGLLLAGEYPGAKTSFEAERKLESLLACGICCIVSLMEPDETDHDGHPFDAYGPILARLAKARSAAVELLRFPIVDQNVPKPPMMARILGAIMSSMEDHKPVYIHCWGGVGRTGTVVGSFLMEHGLATAGNVLDVIAELRRNDPKHYRTSPETEVQRDFVRRWGEGDGAQPTGLARSLGCLIGGAVGDALGAPVEFMNRKDILDRFGPRGITTYAPAYGGIGTITDDTQMTLFTAEGLLRGHVRGRHKSITTYTGVTARAYLRWLHTQGERSAHDLYIETNGEGAGWLIRQQALHSRRAPGNTCLSALRAMQEIGKPARNSSKGCGGVMRVAPVGLFHWRLKNNHSPGETFQLGTELAALTHGHPTGSLTGGVLSVLIRELADGASLPEALAAAKALLRQAREHEETLACIELAEKSAESNMPHADAIARIGQGWIAEEALAVSIYCALVARDLREGIILAVNHDGDSDSTGAITGNLLGAIYGVKAIPQEWLDSLELREVITAMAEDLYFFPKGRRRGHTLNCELI